MIGIQIAQFGIFLILLQMATLLFADGLLLFGVIHMMASGELELGFKMFMLGGISLVIGLLVGGGGKLLCLGAPEEGTRKLIIGSLACDLIGGVLRFLQSSGKFSFTGEGIVLYILTMASFAFFLAFLARMGDNIGEPKVRQYIGLIYGLIGGGFVLLVVLFFSWKLALLLLGLDILVSLGLYTYTIYTLFRAMPLYIEEVKAGIVDPTESAETRAEAEKKARREGPKKTRVAARVAEAPKGEPPVGALLYRIPKDLEPLHVAVKEGDRHKLEMCLAQGVSPMEPVRHGLTPLHIAASVGVMDVADALLVAGANVDATCEEGLTPLFFAVQTANPYIAGLFLTRGANVHHANAQGLMPIHWACCAPHSNLEGASRLNMVETLLGYGADLTARTKDGKTPRDLAEENELKELVQSIDRQLGTSSASTAPQAAETPSYAAPASGVITTESGATVKAFRGIRLVVIPNDLPELHAAVKDGDPEKVERQLAAGAVISDRIEGGIAPIHITAITGVMSVSQLLLRYGADVDDLCDHLLTPMFLAVVVNNVGMVGFMRSRGANINHRDEEGRTPLHWAAGVEHEKLDRQNRLKMVNFLLESGADPTLKDDAGMTAAQIAVTFGHEDVAAVLQELVAPEATEAPGEDAAGDEDEYYV